MSGLEPRDQRAAMLREFEKCKLATQLPPTKTSIFPNLATQLPPSKPSISPLIYPNQNVVSIVLLLYSRNLGCKIHGIRELVSLQGYNPLILKRRRDMRGGGVGFYVKKIYKLK
jgi:hypothetical protein